MILTAEMLEEVYAWPTIISTFREKWPNGVKITPEFIKKSKDDIGNIVLIHSGRLFAPKVSTKTLPSSFFEDLIKPSSYSIYRDLRIQARKSLQQQIDKLEEEELFDKIDWDEMCNELADAWERYDEDCIIAIVTALNHQYKNRKEEKNG